MINIHAALIYVNIFEKVLINLFSLPYEWDTF